MKQKTFSLKNNNLYYKFLGVLTKKGNKNAAKKILDETFLKLSLKHNKSLQKLFLQIFIKLNSFVEVKSVRVRRASHMVPFSINIKRRSYLILKWLTTAIKEEDTQQNSMIEKLYLEITNLIQNTQSKALKKKKQNTINAVKNRSNLHFRW
jgi:ribosomal protein S7